MIFRFLDSDSASLSSNNSNDLSNDYNEHQTTSPPNALNSPSAVPDVLDNIQNYRITTEINDSGRVFRISVKVFGNVLSRIDLSSSLQVSAVRKEKNMQSTLFPFRVKRFIYTDSVLMNSNGNG